MNVTFNIIDGVAPYVVSLNYGLYEYVYLTSGIKTITGLPAGDYIMTIEDSIGCITTASFTLSEETTTTTTSITTLSPTTSSTTTTSTTTLAPTTSTTTTTHIPTTSTTTSSTSSSTTSTTTSIPTTTTSTTLLPTTSTTTTSSIPTTTTTTSSSTTAIPTTTTTTSNIPTSTTTSSTSTSIPTTTTTSTTSVPTTTTTTTHLPTTTTTTTIQPTTTSTTSTSTSTSTSSTTTTTTTVAPLDFDISFSCEVTIIVSGNNARGGTGGYQFGTTIFTSQAAALANTNWVTTSNVGYNVGTTNGTYWIILRDISNVKKTKSITTNCVITTTTTSSTSTSTTSTSTSTTHLPTTTTTSTTQIPPTTTTTTTQTTIAPGALYYIATTGNDSTGNGTYGNPWKTLSYACAHVSIAGSTIHVKAGIYTETQQCNLAVGVNIIGEGVENTFIHGSLSNSWTLYLYSSSVTNGNQSISNIAFDGDLTGYGAIGSYRRNNVLIHDCSFSDFVTMGVYFGNTTPTTSFASGCKFYNNTLSNCAAYDANGSRGNLNIFGYSGFLCYNNTMTLPKRGTTPAGFGIKTNYTQGLQIYNNTIIINDNDDGAVWSFAVELWNTSDGCDIYSNTFRGAVDFAGDYTKKGNSSYSVRFRNNIVGHTTLQAVARKGILLECEAETLSDFYIYDNEFKNLQSGISIYTLAASKYNNIYIYRNTFNTIGATINNYWGNCINGSGNAGFTLNNLYIWNNTMVSNRGTNYLSAIMLNCRGTVTNVYIKNNIIKDFGTTYLTSNTTAEGTIDNVYIQHNDVYGCGASNEPVWGAVTPTNITKDNILKVDPKLVSTSDFHLQSSSPCINAGVDVGLPYTGSAPDLGYAEYTP